MSTQLQNSECGHWQTDDAPCQCHVRDTMEHAPITTAMSVEAAQREKWRQGQIKYGPAFVGDPIQELYAEYVDSLNYFDEIERRGAMTPNLEYARLTTRRLAELVRGAVK